MSLNHNTSGLQIIYSKHESFQKDGWKYLCRLRHIYSDAPGECKRSTAAAFCWRTVAMATTRPALLTSSFPLNRFSFSFSDAQKEVQLFLHKCKRTLFWVGLLNRCIQTKYVRFMHLNCIWNFHSFALDIDLMWCLFGSHTEIQQFRFL